MQPSSLVFLILIAIWAAYLLQHWVRRREHLATARSVDRFSAAMHVLERRAALAELDLTAPGPRSYAVSPARSSRQEVVVKRAQSPTSNVPVRPTAPVRPTRVFHVLAGVSARLLRGLSLLVSLSMTVVVSALAAFSALPWWSVVVAVAVLVADVAWLRYEAVSLRTSGWSSGPAAPSAPGLDRSARVRPMFRRSAEAKAETEAGPDAGPGSEAHSQSESEPDSEPDFGRTSAVAGPVGVNESTASATGTDPNSWAPIPVPPPTYTLKAKAVPPAPPTAPVGVAETGGAQSWSLDGLVYDYDLDELVERRAPAPTEPSVRAV